MLSSVHDYGLARDLQPLASGYTRRRQRDSNPRPSDYKSVTDCLSSRERELRRVVAVMVSSALALVVTPSCLLYAYWVIGREAREAD